MGGGGLNFDDFLPAHVQSLSRGPRSTVPVSESDAIEKISGESPHPRPRNLRMFSRNTFISMNDFYFQIGSKLHHA